jgi:hypothetical protein
MKKMLTLLVALVVIAGCATDTGVVRASDTTYKIYRRGAGFVGSERIEADEMKQAGAFCADMGKTMQVVRVMTGAPPYLSFNFPKAEVEFRCVDAASLQPSQKAR